MVREEQHYWLIFIFVAWAVPTIVAWSVEGSLELYFVLLVWQQSLFVLGGLWGSRHLKRQPWQIQTIFYGLGCGIGLFFLNALVGTLNFQLVSKVVGLETSQKLILQERGGVQAFLQSDSPLLVTGVIFLLIIGAPLGEELFFRRFLLSTWQQAFGTKWAIFLSSLLFAVLHFYLVQFIPVLLAGIMLGVIYVRTNNIMISVIAHAVVNTIVLVLQLSGL